MVTIILIIYFELNLGFLKKKILEKKDLFPLKFFDIILSINLRVIMLNIYYTFFFDKNSKKMYGIIISPDSKLRKIFNKKYMCNFIGLSLIIFDLRLWIIYWVVNEFVDVVGTQISSDYDQALFGKNLGHDIQVTPSGFLKLVVYKKFLLNNKSYFSELLTEHGVVIGYRNMDFGFDLNDFFYLDAKTQYLASIDCLYY